MRWSTPVRHDRHSDRSEARRTPTAFTPRGTPIGPVGPVRQTPGTPPGISSAACNSTRAQAGRPPTGVNQHNYRFQRISGSPALSTSLSPSEQQSSVSAWQVARSESPVTFLTPRSGSQARGALTPRRIHASITPSDSGASTPPVVSAQVLSRVLAAHANVGSMTAPAAHASLGSMASPTAHASLGSMTASVGHTSVGSMTVPGKPDTKAEKGSASVTRSHSAPPVRTSALNPVEFGQSPRQLGTSSVEAPPAPSQATSARTARAFPSVGHVSVSESQTCSVGNRPTLEDRVARLESTLDEQVLKITKEVMNASNALAKAIEERLMQQLWDMRKELCEEFRVASSADVSTATPEFAPKGMVEDAGPVLSPKEDVVTGRHSAHFEECIVERVKRWKEQFAQTVSQNEVDELDFHSGMQIKSDGELRLQSSDLQSLQDNLKQAMNSFRDGIHGFNESDTDAKGMQHIVNQSLKMSEFLAQELAQERNQRMVYHIFSKRVLADLDNRFQQGQAGVLAGHDGSISPSMGSEETMQLRG